jgi:hypothetical protein
MLWFVALTPVFILFSFFIADWAGQNRRTGFWWTFFFGLTLTPMAAYLIALLSGKREEKAKIGLFGELILVAVIVMSLPFAIFLLIKGMETVESTGGIYMIAATGLSGLYYYSCRLFILLPTHSG